MLLFFRTKTCFHFWFLKNIYQISLFNSTPEKNTKYVLPLFKITHLLTISISPLSREIFFSWDFHWNFNWKNISRNLFASNRHFSFVKINRINFTQLVRVARMEVDYDWRIFLIRLWGKLTCLREIHCDFSPSWMNSEHNGRQ